MAIFYVKWNDIMRRSRYITSPFFRLYSPLLPHPFNPQAAQLPIPYIYIILLQQQWYMKRILLHLMQHKSEQLQQNIVQHF